MQLVSDLLLELVEKVWLGPTDNLFMQPETCLRLKQQESNAI